MNAEMIINALVLNGYRKVPQPLHVADLNFDFSGALTGPFDQESLTLVLEGEGRALVAAEHRLRAFATVLERTGSVRPINVVVLSKKPDPDAITALQEVARVVVVDPNRPLIESVNVLLPLQLPEPVASSGSAEAALLEELGAAPDAVSARLLKAARESSEKVRVTMHAILKEAAEERQ
jgi:hypothetical protein